MSGIIYDADKEEDPALRNYSLTGRRITHDDLFIETGWVDPELVATARCQRTKMRSARRCKYLLCSAVVVLCTFLLFAAIIMLTSSWTSDDEKAIGDLLFNNVTRKNISAEEYFSPFIFTTKKPEIIPVTKTFHAIIPTEISHNVSKIIGPVPVLGQSNELIPVQDCQYHYEHGSNVSQVYLLTLSSSDAFSAFCQIESRTSWIVIQRRSGPSVSFWNQTYDSHVKGFGDLERDHWLGLEKMYALQRAKGDPPMTMRIELSGDLCEGRKCKGEKDGLWWGEWKFKINGSEDGFRIYNLSLIAGNLSDPSASKDVFSDLNNGQQFTTVDRDNDKNQVENCALYKFHGGWWHRDCTYVALNGMYGSKNSRVYGQFWHFISTSGTYNLKPKKSLMMIKAV